MYYEYKTTSQIVSHKSSLNFSKFLFSLKSSKQSMNSEFAINNQAHYSTAFPFMSTKWYFNQDHPAPPLEDRTFGS